MSTLNHLWHETIEECHDQCVDVRTIDIGIRHDDNLIVTKFVNIGILRILAIYTKAYTDTLDDVHHRL